MPGAGKSFICYSRSDSSFALKLAKNLRNNKADIWMDEFDIPPGVDWDTAIATALEECHSLIVLLSPEAIASGNVLNEISYARDNNMRIIPLMLKTCRVPLIITRKNYIDFRTDAGKGLEKLLYYLNNPEKTEIGIAPPYRNYKLIFAFVAAAIVCSGIVFYRVDNFNRSKERESGTADVKIKKNNLDTAGRKDSTGPVAGVVSPPPHDSAVKPVAPKTFSADFASADIIKMITAKTGLVNKVGSANYRITLSYKETNIQSNTTNTAYMLTGCFPIIKINGVFCTEATCCKIESSVWAPNKSMVIEQANKDIRASAVKCYRYHIKNIIACLQ